MNYSTRVVLQMTDVIGEYHVIEKDSYDYAGPVDKCCGPSGQETAEAGSAQTLSTTLAAAFNQNFGNQGKILANLNGMLSPIASAGPSQQGFSAPELANLNTQAINSAGAAAKNAKQAAGNFSAGQGGGGTSGLTSGVTKQINASVDSAAADQLATQQGKITQANYDQGNANWTKAQGFLAGVAQQYNPESYGSVASSSNANAFNEANTVQQQKNQEEQAIAGGITGLATGLIAPGLSAGISMIDPNADTSILDSV